MSTPTELCKAGAADLQTLRDRIMEENRKAQGAARKSLGHVRACGEMLIELKARLPHGLFRTQLISLNIEPRTASNYMAVARKWETVSHLPRVKDALRLLSMSEESPSSPPANPRPSPPPAIIEAEVVEPLTEQKSPRLAELEGIIERNIEENPEVFKESPPPAEVKAKPTDSFLEIVRLLPDLTGPQFHELITIIQTRWLR